MDSKAALYQYAPEPSPLTGGSESPGDIPFAKIRVPTKATRRIRGEIACAECRRLKIRCDRTVPCSTCVKRGCGALCPNGTIPPGEGSRFVLAATDHLHQKMSKMEARMRSLEDALAIIHSAESDRPHPLLSSKDDAEEDEEPTLKAATEEAVEPPLPLSQPQGTLWIDAQGDSVFFGPSGGSESLLMSAHLDAEKAALFFQELDPSYLPAEINHCYQSFPFTPPNVIASSVQQMIESFLPSMDRAITLCDTFLEHLSWMFQIVSRHHLVNVLIPIIYKQNSASYGPHDLALLLSVLALGSLLDLNLPPYNLEAQHYHRLSRAALTLQPVLGAQSVVTIKVLHLMSVYYGMSGKEVNLGQSYMLLDLAGQVALRIGFHIDPSMWGFEGREAYDRRVYFWNLMAGVLMQSLAAGRPPSLMMSYIDCRIPTEEEEALYQEGEVPLGFGVWGFKVNADCMIPLARLVLGAKLPTYEAVMELHRKIQDCTVPRPDLLQSQTERTAVSMQTFVRSHFQNIMLMILHRVYFAQAMTEYPDNAFHSPYSQSVHASYSSACIILQDTKEQFNKMPLLCSRIWMVWSFAFSAAVIVGTTAIRGVHLNLKPPPKEEFEEIFRIFTIVSETSSRAARAMPILEVILQKIYKAHRYYQLHGKPAVSDPQEVDELLYFGGGTSAFQRNSSDKPQPYQPLTPPHTGFQNQPQKTSPPRVAHQLSSAAPLTYPATPQSNSGLKQMPSHHIHHSPSDLLPSPVIVSSMGESHHQPFTNYSGGWNESFHGGPGRSSFGVHPASNLDIAENFYQKPPTIRAPHRSYIPVPGDGLILEDRWASSMNYDLLREPTHGRPPSH